MNGQITTLCKLKTVLITLNWISHLLGLYHFGANTIYIHDFQVRSLDKRCLAAEKVPCELTMSWIRLHLFHIDIQPNFLCTKKIVCMNNIQLEFVCPIQLEQQPQVLLVNPKIHLINPSSLTLSNHILWHKLFESVVPC